MKNRINLPRQITLRLTSRGLFSTILLFAVTILLFSASVSATGESYLYGNSGTEIAATGGLFGNNVNVKFTKTPNNYIKAADGTFSLSVGGDYYMFNGAPEDESNACLLSLQIFVKKGDGNSATGWINPNPYPSTSHLIATGDIIIDDCSEETTASVTKFDNTVITIDKDATYATPVTGIAETEATQKISVTVYSDKPALLLPLTAKVTISAPPATMPIRMPWMLSFLDSAGTSSDTAYFYNVEQGSYKICIEASGASLLDECRDVTKGPGELNINFGNPDTVFDVGGKKVHVDVKIALSSSSTNHSNSIYGPMNITLEGTDTNGGAITKATVTDKFTVDTDGTSGPITLKANFDSIEPGTYKVCVTGQPDMCSDPIIKNNRLDVATINIPADQSDQFITTPTEESKCAIAGIGWILCPVLNTMGFMADQMLSLFTGFLQVDAPKVLGTNTTTYAVWQKILSIANVIFVIIFLIVIFSQITNIGITNYGIKKILPKLIIAAILVNLSFYICQIAVDLSNITGNSIQNLLDTIAPGVTNLDGVGPWSGTGTEGGFWSTILTGTGGILVGVGAVFMAWGALATIIPALIAAIVALIMILFILIGRQALIILLTIVAPLAIAAMILPNTEKLFKTWQKTFLSMLLLYPIVTSVFGVSKLASDILKPVFTAANNQIGQILAGAIMVIPLFVVPGLLKNSMSSLGSIGTKISGMSDKWSKGAGDRVKNTRAVQHIKSSQERKSALIQSGEFRGKKWNPNSWRSGAHRLINTNTGTYGAKEAARGASVMDTIDAEAIKLSDGQLSRMNLTKDENEALARGKKVERINSRTGKNEVIADGSKNKALRRSAIKTVVASNNVNGINAIWDDTKTMGNSEEENNIRKSFAESLSASNSRPVYLGAGAIAAMRIGNNDSSEDTIIKAVNDGAYSAEKIAGADKDDLIEVGRVIKEHSAGNTGATGKITIEAHQRVVDNAYKATQDEILSTKLGKNLSQVKDISTNTPPPPPPPTP